MPFLFVYVYNLMCACYSPFSLQCVIVLPLQLWVKFVDHLSLRSFFFRFMWIFESLGLPSPPKGLPTHTFFFL